MGEAVFMIEALREFVSGFMDRCARNAMHKVMWKLIDKAADIGTGKLWKELKKRIDNKQDSF